MTYKKTGSTPIADRTCTKEHTGLCVLGIDPGLSRTGWGVIQGVGSGRMMMQEYGCITTKPSVLLVNRLTAIHESVQSLIHTFQPDIVALEELFFSKEARTVAAVSQARGAILAAAGQEHIPVFEYNPRHVKMALTGYGSADKNQIQQMVKMLLRLPAIPQPDDAADALAIAICHLNTHKVLQ